MARCWWESRGSATVDRYVQLFSEAGIAVASFTFSAAAVHAAIRLNGHAAKARDSSRSAGRPAGAVEVYGESASRPVFSAEFDLAPQRAAILALAELRLPPETAPLQLEEVLPKPAVNPVENDLSRNALPYATALAGLVPGSRRRPTCCRRSTGGLNSRAVLIPTIVLAALVLLLAAGGMLVYSRYAERQYLHELQAEIARLQPQAARAAALDREIDSAARAGPPARPVSRADAPRSGCPERTHPADGAARLDQQHRSDARCAAHHRRSAAGRRAGEDSGFVALLQEYAIWIQITRTPAGIEQFSDSRQAGGTAMTVGQTG